MKIFLAQKLSYSPSWTGAAKSNRELLQYLSRRGHLCSVLALADTATHFPSRHEWRNESLNSTEEGYSPWTEGF
ncbi:MAG: hypothetical protein ACXWXZ_15750, partial [Candidatus Binatia bacterium]